ncbi:hypothetical protein, partial [Nostoc sp.]|uniref:hypothetical protein n=1 Tax=Nostoc sp. TaxID=1180 RepID=UPI002FF45034
DNFLASRWWFVHCPTSRLTAVEQILNCVIMEYMFFIYPPNLYEGWGFSLLFIFCSLKALPNIKLIKKSHRAIIKKKTPHQSHHNNKILFGCILEIPSSTDV